MNPHDQPPPEAVLQAWVDDRLTDAERVRVADYLEANPAVASRLQSYRDQNEALRAAMRARFPEQASRRSGVETLGAEQARRRSPAALGRVAALIGATVLGALAGGGGVALWSGRDPSAFAPVAGGPTLPSDAFVAHRTYTAEVRHFVEVAASEQHLLPWLSNRVGRLVVAPDLAGLGFRLIGGRVLPTPDAQAAQLMYEDAAGARLTVYLRADPDAGETAFRFEERDGVNGFWWSDQGFGYALFAPIDRERLLAAAELIHEQVGP